MCMCMFNLLHDDTVTVTIIIMIILIAGKELAEFDAIKSFDSRSNILIVAQYFLTADNSNHEVPFSKVR